MFFTLLWSFFEDLKKSFITNIKKIYQVTDTRTDNSHILSPAPDKRIFNSIQKIDQNQLKDFMWDINANMGPRSEFTWQDNLKEKIIKTRDFDQAIHNNSYSQSSSAPLPLKHMFIDKKLITSTNQTLDDPYTLDYKNLPERIMVDHRFNLTKEFVKDYFQNHPLYNETLCRKTLLTDEQMSGLLINKAILIHKEFNIIIYQAIQQKINPVSLKYYLITTKSDSLFVSKFISHVTKLDAQASSLGGSLNHAIRHDCFFSFIINSSEKHINFIPNTSNNNQFIFDIPNNISFIESLTFSDVIMINCVLFSIIYFISKIKQLFAKRQRLRLNHIKNNEESLLYFFLFLLLSLLFNLGGWINNKFKLVKSYFFSPSLPKENKQTPKELKENEIQEFSEKKIFIQEKATLLQEKATLLEEKATLLEEKATLLQEKTQEKEILLQEKATLLQEKTTLLQKVKGMVEDLGIIKGHYKEFTDAEELLKKGQFVVDYCKRMKFIFTLDPPARNPVARKASFFINDVNDKEKADEQWDLIDKHIRKIEENNELTGKNQVENAVEDKVDPFLLSSFLSKDLNKGISPNRKKFFDFTCTEGVQSNTGLASNKEKAKENLEKAIDDSIAKANKNVVINLEEDLNVDQIEYLTITKSDYLIYNKYELSGYLFDLFHLNEINQNSMSNDFILYLLLAGIIFFILKKIKEIICYFIKKNK